MFVSAQKYRRLQKQYQEAQWLFMMANAHADSLEAMLDHVMDELEHAINKKQSSLFTNEQLRSIRRMVHPDRNPGNTSAHEITQIINGMLK